MFITSNVTKNCRNLGLYEENIENHHKSPINTQKRLRNGISHKTYE